jgi:eukaryotic-like serine/threonine-protein kinase
MIDHNAVTHDGANAILALGAGGLPAEIGPYKILETLGVGGMGQVLLGQSEVPKRKVAIKLMLSAGFNADSIMRFRREMEVLARLEHPGIARLFEVGSAMIAGTEQPWYAMEYVPGLPVDVFVKRQKSDIKAVFRLVAHIAHALHYAHQKGVIHRDIKPANILVDANGVPKILDFGIARLNDADATDTAKFGAADLSAQTRFGQIIGTLAYMSPEQMSAGTNADVRSDVYALGVVLYELLTGALPIKISTTSLLDAIKEVAEGKRIALSTLQPSLRGEVELIVDTASNRDISQRYDSAASFAGDLENYLTNRPLIARRPNFSYVAAKFVRRNPLLVGVFALAITGIVTASAIAVRNTIRAERALVRAEAIASFLRDVLSGTNADTATDQAPSVQRLLESSADTLNTRFPDDPLLRVQLRQIIAEGLMGAGQYSSAKIQIDLALQEKLDQVPSHTVPANLLFGLRLEAGIAARLNSDFAVAEKLLRPLVAEHSRDAALDLRAHKELADTLNEQSQCANALPFYQYAVDHAPPSLLEIKTNALSGYASCLGELGQNTRAIAMMKLQLAAEIEQFGELNSEPLNTRHNLASLLRQQGKFNEAYRQIRQAFEGRKRLLGPTQKRTLNSQVSLATMLRLLKRPLEALPLAQDALKKFRDTLGVNFPETRTACDALANIELSANQRRNALLTWRNCLAQAKTSGAWDNAESIKMRSNHGIAWCTAPASDQGVEVSIAVLPVEQLEAAQSLHSALASGTLLWGENNFQTARIEANLGRCLAETTRASTEQIAQAKLHLSHAIALLTPSVDSNDAQLEQAKRTLQGL